MGYGFYTVNGWERHRPCGYMVQATCDQRGCEAKIDRGLGYLCGDVPHGPFDDDRGCGRYYCASHLGWVGERGGCQHRVMHSGRLTKAWGRTLSDMAPNQDGSIVCLDPIGHEGPHAWDRSAS